MQKQIIDTEEYYIESYYYKANYSNISVKFIYKPFKTIRKYIHYDFDFEYGIKLKINDKI